MSAWPECTCPHPRCPVHERMRRLNASSSPERPETRPETENASLAPEASHGPGKLRVPEVPLDVLRAVEARLKAELEEFEAQWDEFVFAEYM